MGQVVRIYQGEASGSIAAKIERAEREAGVPSLLQLIRQEQERRRVAREAEPAVMAARSEPQNRIRIYWNGIRMDGGKLIRCYYSLDNDCTVKGECVSISARDCADLPRDLLPVRNDTDIYTDYFDSDRATLTPDHPLYRYFRYAAMKARARDDGKYCEKLRAELESGRREPWPGHFDALRADLASREAFLANYAGMTDPGQPTAGDLEAIDRRRQETENARRAAEHEAELKAREAVLNMKSDGRRLIDSTAEAHPIREGEPVVTIEWSEHPAFYQWEDGALKLSVRAADHILGALDLKAHNDREHGYYKTSFRITGATAEGEAISYEGRYDLGDGEGGMIRHIRNLGEWERTHEQFGKEKAEPDETSERLQFAEYLEQFMA